MSKSNWFRLDKHMLLYFQRDVRSEKEKAAFLDSLTEALVTDSKGLNPLADHLIQEREDFRAKAIESGRIGRQIQLSLGVSGGGRGTPRASGGTSAGRTDGRTDISSDSDTEDAHVDFGKNSGDKYERIMSIPDAKLPEFAAEFCGDSDREKGVGGFKKRMREVGPAAFRSVLSAFVGEVESGEEPRNRGSALQARLKKAVAS